MLEENDLTRLVLDSDGPSFWNVHRDLSKIAERTWAFLTIKQLLDEKLAAQEDPALVKELDSRILELSLKVSCLLYTTLVKAHNYNRCLVLVFVVVMVVVVVVAAMGRDKQYYKRCLMRDDFVCVCVCVCVCV